MTPFQKLKEETEVLGFSIANDIYSSQEIKQIIALIESRDSSNERFRKSTAIFAIRQFFKEIPQSIDLILNNNLKNIIQHVLGNDYFIAKSIYFDKPAASNWSVPYHQDLTIAVDKKVNLENFNFWTFKQNQFAVQPPLPILENNYTIRIHLDKTDETNGALKVIPKSHLKKIYRPESIHWKAEKEVICTIPEGGIMIMKPLILHSSSKSNTNRRRRVIHIEFSNSILPHELNWSEKINLK